MTIVIIRINKIKKWKNLIMRIRIINKTTKKKKLFKEKAK